ncbi:MAG: intracellular sulfur oxidation DsrE/DsrF family protein [Pseudohongiellaceae bacterium]
MGQINILERLVMSENLTHNRRKFLAGAGLIAAGAAAAANAQEAGHSQHDNSGFTPARHAEDSWMDEMGGVHRAFIDSSTGPGGIAAMNFAANILLAHAQGYGGSDKDYGLIVCFRHNSSPYGFNDAMWEKYGELFAGRTKVSNSNGGRVTVNPLSVERIYGNRSNTIDNMSSRGVRFAVCDLSTRGMAGMLARSSGRTPAEVYEELVANAVPSSHFVPAGVMAATRAQEYGFSFLFATE